MSADVTFQELRGPAHQGDTIFIHPRAEQAVLIAGVAGETATQALTACRNWLTEHAGERALQPRRILEALHKQLCGHGSAAEAAVVTRVRGRFQVDYTGAVGLYRIQEAGSVQPLISPEGGAGGAHLGGPNFPEPGSHILDPDDDLFLLGDGLDPQALRDTSLTPEDLRDSAPQQTLSSLAAGRQWSALLFPVAEQVNMVRAEWPCDPFRGPQEERRHERKGLQRIADHLFKHSRLHHFRIVSCPPAIGARSSRLYDGLLLCPVGAFLLELKDHRGRITLHLEGSNPNRSMVIETPDGDRRAEADPVRKLRDGLRSVGDLPALRGLDTQARRHGTVVFTHPAAEVICRTADGEHPLPYWHGDVLITRPQDLPDALWRRGKEYCGKRLDRPAVTPDGLDYLAKSILEPEDGPANVQPGGGYEVDFDHPLKEESNEYYTVFPATFAGDAVWAKRFDLPSMSGTSRAAELQRIGRETGVLHRLSRRRIPGIPYFYESRDTEEALYVFLEPAAAQTLEGWLATNPDRSARLRLMRSVATTLKALADLEPPVVHRAVHPRNIRVTDFGEPQLVHFELCQSDTLATVLVDARRTFREAYQAPEVGEPGKRLTPAADVYSFMLCLYYVLAGEELVADRSTAFRQRAARQRNYYSQLVKSLGLSPEEASLWQRGLHETAAERPDFREIIEAIERWLAL